MLALTALKAGPAYRPHLQRMITFLEANASVVDFVPGLVKALKAGKLAYSGYDWTTLLSEVGSLTKVPDVTQNIVFKEIRSAL